jgi:maltose O-acetyltransferase
MNATLKKLVYSVMYRAYIVLQNAQRAHLASKFKSCGRDVSFYMPVVIDGAEHMEVGDNVAIGPYVHMWAQGGITIGNRVMIGSHAAITSLTHDYSSGVMYGTLIEKKIVIDDDVWIGAHSVILPGVTIGSGAVIGAGAVVTRSVDPDAVMVGVPAQFWKKRHMSTSDHGSGDA